MRNLNFEGFKPDSLISGIGHFFRTIDGNRWNIDIKLSPKQSKDFTTASNASQLIRGHVINPVKKKNKKGWGLPFRITDATIWETNTIGDCPVIRSEKGTNPHQLCFVFPISGDITVYLPHFELARTLFFHGAYLSRTALESTCLKTDFDVEIDDEKNAMIRSINPSTIPVNHLNEPKTRNYLAWLLLHEGARKSYESIAHHQRLKGREVKRYRRWNFQFNPPSLKDVNLFVTGQFCGDTRTLFVYEIKKIKGIPNKQFKSISIWHPDFENSIPGEGHSVQPAGGTQDESMTIYDDVDPNANMQPILIEGNAVSIEFKNSFYVTKTTTKEKTRPTIHTNDETKDSITSVSTEEGIADQGIPGGDWDSIKDETDYDELFESKFECFMKMVSVLIEHHGCTLIDKTTTQLRKVGKSKKHLLSTDGSYRNMAIVQLNVQGKSVHMLEVDTSDAEQSLSTHIMVLNDKTTAKASLKELKVELVRSSLRWPKKLLDKICGQTRHKGINHPQSPASNKGLLAPDSITRWANRIHAGMTTL